MMFLVVPADSREQTAPLAVRLDRLLDTGAYDEARQLLRRSVGSGREAALHYAHFEGLILVRQNRHEDAIALFREIVAAAPDFSPSRVELARLLYRAGQADGASYHFEAISLGEDDIGLKRLAQAYLDRMRSERPYGFSGYLSILPSTNVNRGTRDTIFESGLGSGVIGDDARETSGIGIAAGGSAYREWTLGDASSLVWTGAADIRKYTSTDAFDQLGLSITAAYVRPFGNVTARIGPSAEYVLVAWAPYLARYGVTAGASVPLSRKSVAQFSLSMLRQDYTELDYRDGWLGYGNAALRHMLSPSLGVTAIVGFTVERTDRAHLDHDDHNIALQLDKEWRGGLIASIYGGYEGHRYRGVFPLTSTPRRDRQLFVGGRVAHRALSFRGFAPQLTYRYTHQQSNISFYDYQAHDLGVTLTKRF